MPRNCEYGPDRNNRFVADHGISRNLKKSLVAGNLNFHELHNQGFTMTKGF
jgi:hypothetical protein